jgi:outer membrane biosynthesis protein TonB
MSLSGSRAGRSIEITWNASAPIFASARVGILGISDGAVNKEITLTSSQLHAQKLVYMPATTRVEAVLEVYASDGRISRESAMFVLPPADDPPPAAPARRTVVAETRTAMRTSEQGQTRTFVPPNSGRSAASERAVIIDAPPHIETAQTRLISNLQSPIASVTGPQLPDNLRIPRASGPATTQPPRPLRQVRPTIPSNIGAMLSRTTEVAVRIHVDASGKVVAAEPLGSAGGLNRYLGAASAAAAKMWSFEPARHGDAKVPGTMILKFVFGPGK